MANTSTKQEIINSKKLLFDRWAPSYDWLLPSVFYQAVHQRLLGYVTLPQKSQVMDLGCGTGRLLNRLAGKFADLQGTGLDLSPQMLRIARRSNSHHPRLIFVEGKADALPFASEQFDAVFNTISFLHYPEPEKVLAEIARVLKPGGNFYLVDWTARNDIAPQLMTASGGIKFYSPQTRKAMGETAGLVCTSHHYLISSVLLTVFRK
ncbi:class I SAM-dependent methyltransferase [Calothrix sp. 336/3]|uniref:class I SAM-dependent methyltransferase n=1 Tax=Calothrix sp. 336/3 TaxID=1337936 RepID=UPI0004E38140|nr:class I SAM-dependent methyltransferase [Calothrix sp. 336/3]AKG23242.1 methyltransferase type 11 [Calothrix sp. 336/3]